MHLTRRTLMKTASAASLVAVLPRAGQAAFLPVADGWRQFAITTRIALPAGTGAAQAWVPVSAVSEEGWMRPGENDFTTSANDARIMTDASGEATFLHARWGAGPTPKELELTSTFSTQSRSATLSQPGDTPALSSEDRALYTRATALLPTDGIVAETAQQITGGLDGDLAKARAIYDWVVENTARNPETRGCGMGDIASMLQMGDLTGKCADLNALYVGLARAAGLPARDVYGVRVAASAFGYQSLGTKSEDITGAQHCRAEVFLDGFGWIAVDPADVRKVMLEEPPKDLALDDPKVVDARKALFGGWEGNWLAYNFAHDVTLPGTTQAALPFLMYPQVEVAGQLLDPLDKDSRAYTITAHEIA